MKIQVSEIRNTFGTFIYIKQNICRRLELQISEKFKRFFLHVKKKRNLLIFMRLCIGTVRAPL